MFNFKIMVLEDNNVDIIISLSSLISYYFLVQIFVTSEFSEVSRWVSLHWVDMLVRFNKRETINKTEQGTLC